ncbi:MAG TPA: amidohydrolase family protein [Jatrophihabitans sp.]|jgi:predicted TIM-barrel fold metal-dependent hydrolase
MTVTDAQVHIWLPESADRQWPAGGTAHAHAKSFGPNDLLAAMAEAGVDRAVLVPPSWEGDRNDYCSAAAAAFPDRFVYLARLDLASEDVTNAYDRVRDSHGFKGFRLTFRKKESRELLLDGAVEWFWKAAERDQLPVCVYVPDLLSEFVDIASRYRGLKLGIDHLGLPLDSTEADFGPVTAQLLDFVDYENVVLKATCLPSHVTDDYPFTSLHAPLERLIAAFGARRVFWGSDLSRLRCSYDEVRRLFTEELAFLSGPSLDQTMGRGVEEWLGWTHESF